MKGRPLVAALLVAGIGLSGAPAVQAAPNPTGPSASTPTNPKIVAGRAGEGFFDPTKPGYSQADPGRPTTSTQTMNATAFDPAPYSSLRWATTPEDANGHPWICIGNFIYGDAWQDRVIAWDYVADQLTYAYQIGQNACSGWGNNEKIDITVGTNPNSACAYVYKAWNAQSQLTRVIVYINHSKQACYETTNPTAELTVRHWKSQAIGLGLGNLQFNGGGPSWFSVMDMTITSYSVPEPERGDGLTYDWYN